MFQLVWLVCVQGESTWAAAATLLALLLHWRFVMINPQEWRLWLAALVCGFVVDGAMIAVGVLQPVNATVAPPFWLLCLWVMFATTLMHSLSLLQRSLSLAACVGCIGGPLSYYVGMQFGAAALGVWSGRFGEWVALAALAACWALVLPLLVLLARYLESRGNYKVKRGVL